MFRLLTLAAVIASVQPSSPPPPVIESWTCTVKEQLDRNVSGMLQVLVYPSGERRELSFQINWSAQPGYMAEQQLSWVGIPPAAVTLWKPDKIAFSVSTRRTDERGGITFDSSGFGKISEPARGKVRSLRPTFHSTWVSIDDAYLVSRLWSGWPWEVTLSDRKGVTLGSQAILLPPPEAAQAMFTRMRAELDQSAASKEKECAANPEPSEWERLHEVI